MCRSTGPSRGGDRPRLIGGPAWTALAAGLLLGLLAAAAQADTAEQWMQRADQHVRDQQYRQAQKFYRLVLRLQPDHDVAYDRLVKLHRALPLPAAPEQRDRLAAEFPEGFFLQPTDHYLLLYDAHHVWADTRARMLERLHDRFFADLRRIGLRPLPVDRRLEVVLFAEHADFLQYARDVDRMEHEWSGGYYSSRTNRVAMFNYHTSPLLDEMLTDMQQARAHFEKAKGRTAAADPAQRAQLRRSQRRYVDQRRRYQAAAAYGNIRQTLHEAAHQLAYNSGLQQRGRQYPFWFSEGLATSFETAAPHAPFGPGEINPARLAAIEQARRRRELIPLDELVTLTDPPADQTRRLAAYAQSWALFHYLYRERPAALRRYVAHMQNQPPGPRDPETLRRDFEQTIAPLNEFSPAWQAWLQRLPE